MPPSAPSIGSPYLPSLPSDRQRGKSQRALLIRRVSSHEPRSAGASAATLLCSGASRNLLFFHHQGSLSEPAHKRVFCRPIRSSRMASTSMRIFRIKLLFRLHSDTTEVPKRSRSLTLTRPVQSDWCKIGV